MGHSAKGTGQSAGHVPLLTPTHERSPTFAPSTCVWGAHALQSASARHHHALKGMGHASELVRLRQQLKQAMSPCTAVEANS